MIYLIFLVAVVVLAIVFGPLAVIWALNTLFPIVAIPFTLKTWAAVVVINMTWMYKNFTVSKS